MPKKIEKENKLLAAQSETDPLTGMANRRKLIYRRMRCFRMLINVVHNLLLRYWMWIISRGTMIITGIRRGQMSDCDCGLYKRSCGSTWRLCARYGGDEFVVIYENISKEDAKEYVEELRRKVMELTLPHQFSKMLPIVTITGHVLRCTKGRKQSVGFLMWQMRYYTA